jgi:SAM-dependent methyltransferase
VLDVVTSCLPDLPGHLIDFGCGTGRYTFWAAERSRLVGAFDVSDAAVREIARRRDQAGADNIEVLGPDLDDLESHVDRSGPADLALAIFGVIAHIEGRAARCATLRRLCALTKKDGRVIVSVPNRARRFRAEQRRAGDRDGISYTRKHAGTELTFFYKLYDTREFCSELSDAGLHVERLLPESALPESWVATSPIWRNLDRQLSRLIAPRYGYGFLAVCRPG